MLNRTLSARMMAMLATCGLATSLLAQNTYPQHPAQPGQQQPGTNSTPNQPATTPGQPAQRNWDNQNTRAGMNAGRMNYAAEYRTGAFLIGRDIVDSGDRTTGTIRDAVIDRGTGRVKFFVVRTGTVMGMGGREIAVPFEEFRWNPSSERYALYGGSERLRGYPEYNENTWRGTAAMQNSDARSNAEKMDNANNMNRDRDANKRDASNPNRDTRPTDTTTANRPATNQPAPGNQSTLPGTNPPSTTTQPGTWSAQNSLQEWMNEPSYNDPYAGSWDRGAEQQITGTVTSINRDYASGQNTVVEVRTQDGTTKKVALGPSWYVTGGETALNRGDQVTISAVPMNVARSVQVNGKDIQFRNEQGSGMWANENYHSSGKNFSRGFAQHALLSEVRKADLDCRGATCGKVDDVIVDVSSGAVAFLSIDPDQNFLGIGDTKRLVPWSVASMPVNGKMRLDATKEMLLASPQTPGDLTTLGSADRVNAIYGAYQVTPPRYDSWYNENEWRARRYQWETGYDSNMNNNNSTPNTNNTNRDNMNRDTNTNRDNNQNPRNPK